MTAVSLAVNRGQHLGAFQITDVTVGTAAPSSGSDIEIRYNLLDQNSKNMTREDVYLAVMGLARMLMNGGANVDLTTGPPL